MTFPQALAQLLHPQITSTQAHTRFSTPKKNISPAYTLPLIQCNWPGALYPKRKYFSSLNNKDQLYPSSEVLKISSKGNFMSANKTQGLSHWRCVSSAMG